MPAKHAKICENERRHAYRNSDAHHKNDPFRDTQKAILFRILSRISRANFIRIDFLAFLDSTPGTDQNTPVLCLSSTSLQGIRPFSRFE